MVVSKNKSEAPDHLNHLLAGTLKDKVKKREKRKIKERKEEAKARAKAEKRRPKPRALNLESVQSNPGASR